MWGTRRLNKGILGWTPEGIHERCSVEISDVISAEFFEEISENLEVLLNVLEESPKESRERHLKETLEKNIVGIPGVIHEGISEEMSKFEEEFRKKSRWGSRKKSQRKSRDKPLGIFSGENSWKHHWWNNLKNLRKNLERILKGSGKSSQGYPLISFWRNTWNNARRYPGPGEINEEIPRRILGRILEWTSGIISKGNLE